MSNFSLSSAARLRLAFLAMGVLVGAFALIAAKMHSGLGDPFDRAVLLWFRSSDGRLPIGPPWVQEVARDISALGSFTVLGLLMFGTLGYFVMIRRLSLAGMIVIAALSAVALNSILKELFERERPSLVIPLVRVFTPSFPSGHSTLSAVVYLSAAVLLTRAIGNRRLGRYFMTIAIVVIALIGVSRVYLGVHYPIDVVAGWLVGSAWALGCWLAISRVESRTKLT